MSKMAEDWERAKKDFTAVTGEKKPDENKLFSTHRTGIGKVLKKLDTADDERKMGDLKKQLADLRKKKKDYVALLEKEIAKEKRKDVAKTRSRALKALVAKLDKYEEYFQHQLTMGEAADKGGSPLDILDKGLVTNLRQGVARCTAAVKQIKAKPDPTVYGKEIKEARSLTTALKGFEQLKIMRTKKDPSFRVSTQSQYWIDAANGFIDDLAPYADGGGRGGDKTTMPSNASREDVLAEAKAFAAIVADVKSTFSQVL